MTVQYQVVGAAAHATVDGPHGRRRQLHFKGTLLPPDVPESEVEHLLSVKLIEPIQVGPTVEPTVPEPGEGDGAIDATGGQPDGSGAGSVEAAQGSAGEGEGGDTLPDQPDAEVEQKRAEARAKLPADGSMPDGRMGQPVWVEYLVGKGYGYEALAKEDKPALVEMAKGLNT